MEKITGTRIIKVKGSAWTAQADYLVTEEPLEIRLSLTKAGVRSQKSISVTMRTPGNDEELALGFLFTEGIIRALHQVKKITTAPVRQKEAKENVVVIELADGLEMDFKKLERHFYTTSSCGVCGKTSIEAVEVSCQFEIPEHVPVVKGSVIHDLPQKLLQNQAVFDTTGGLHGAALFDPAGHLITSREDIGRHNAVDKLVGYALKNKMIPLYDKMILVSGRAGFELVQKSIVAGVSIFAAVGAPSSLAVQLAEEAGMTLIGFLRKGQYNIYAHPERISNE